MVAQQGHTSSEARCLGPTSSCHLRKIAFAIADDEISHFSVLPDNRREVSLMWLHEEKDASGFSFGRVLSESQYFLV